MMRIVGAIPQLASSINGSRGERVWMCSRLSRKLLCNWIEIKVSWRRRKISRRRRWRQKLWIENGKNIVVLEYLSEGQTEMRLRVCLLIKYLRINDSIVSHKLLIICCLRMSCGDAFGSNDCDWAHRLWVEFPWYTKYFLSPTVRRKKSLSLRVRQKATKTFPLTAGAMISLPCNENNWACQVSRGRDYLRGISQLCAFNGTVIQRSHYCQ